MEHKVASAAAPPLRGVRSALVSTCFYLVSLAAAFIAGLRSASSPSEPVLRQLQDDGCWLEKRPGEELMSAFLRLHETLFAQKRLPVSAFGMGRPPLQPEAMRQLMAPDGVYHTHADRVNPVTLRATSRFAPKAAAVAQKAGRRTRCLEWDGRWYLAPYRACEEKWTFSLMIRTPSVDVAAKSFRGDLVDIEKQHPSLLGTFDIIFCSQVFEHVSRPHVAATGIAALLAPGGYLIWTAPFMEPTHGVPFDYFRYTLEGARQIFDDGPRPAVERAS
jgi:hypothetical protein